MSNYSFPKRLKNGRYELGDHLLDTANAAIFGCMDLENGKKLIAKFQIMRDPHLQEQLENEIFMMNSITSDYAMHLYDHFYLDPSPEYSDYPVDVILTERAMGGDLFDYIIERPVDEETAATMLYPIVQLFVEMHFQHIIYRDLKPENLVIMNMEDEVPVLKLIDFGFASFLDESGISNDVKGTLEYEAPEVINRMPYTYSADVWTFGATLFVILLQSFPFGNHKDADFMRRVTTADFCDQRNPNDPFFELSEEAQELIMACLQVDPENRPTFEQILNCKWFELFSMKKPYQSDDSDSDFGSDDSSHYW